MEQLFYRKSTAILTIAAVLVLIILLCALLTFLTQYTSMAANAKQLEELAKQVESGNKDKQELIDYMNSNEYVRQWAEANNLIPADTIKYIQTVTGK